MWLIQRENTQENGVDKLFKVEADTDRAYEAESQGLACFEIQDEDDATEKLRSFYDQGLEPGYTYVHDIYGGHKILEKPIYNPINSSDLENEVLKKGPVFVRPHTPITHGLSEGFIVIDDVNMYANRIEYSPSKARAKKKAPEYRQTTMFRYGRIPIYWFGSYSLVIWKNLDLPIEWRHGWGTWHRAEHNFMRVHSRIKRLIITDLRRKIDWYNVIQDASHYVHGAELHQKDNFRSSWAREMRQECEVLGIEIPDYQKTKKKGGKDV